MRAYSQIKSQGSFAVPVLEGQASVLQTFRTWQPDHLKNSIPLTEIGRASAHTHLKTRKIPPRSAGLRRNPQKSVEIRQGLHSAA